MNRVHESQRPLLRAGPINVLQEGACAEPEDFVKSAAQSARVARQQAKHTVREAAHGQSRCARSDDPVSMWRWRRALNRSGEGVAEAGRAC